MSRLSILAALAAVLVTGCAKSDEVAPTGQSLYLRHCASCHGIGGEGDGPLASSLLTPPADLTRIAERSSGTFDEAEVMAFIDGQRSVKEHGPREMPIWGAVFEEEHRGERYRSYTALLHGRALTDYLRSIQRESD
ncbi:MAG: cytochrome c [Deltaproteobacteria bacterium]|nr:cytochrome c [Deltaproteobacteria bacterium]MBW2447884.1 cytochrome c [Deltaproteobacteria bacterium]